MIFNLHQFELVSTRKVVPYLPLYQIANFGKFGAPEGWFSQFPN
jgi:hypothetical protein